MQYDFQGKHILVLEDDALLAMDMEDFLSDLGVDVIGPVSDIAAALVRAAVQKSSTVAAA